MIKIDVNIYHNKDYVRTMPKGYIYIYTTFASHINENTKVIHPGTLFLIHALSSSSLDLYIYIYWLSHELSVQGCTSLLDVLQRRKCENNRTKQTINKQISTQFWTRQTIVYVHGKNATLHSIMCKSSVHIYMYRFSFSLQQLT